MVHISINIRSDSLIVLFIQKVPKVFRGAKTRSPLQQLYFRIHDAQTVAPLKTCFIFNNLKLNY